MSDLNIPIPVPRLSALFDLSHVERTLMAAYASLAEPGGAPASAQVTNALAQARANLLAAIPRAHASQLLAITHVDVADLEGALRSASEGEGDQYCVAGLPFFLRHAYGQGEFEVEVENLPTGHFGEQATCSVRMIHDEDGCWSLADGQIWHEERDGWEELALPAEEDDRMHGQRAPCLRLALQYLLRNFTPPYLVGEGVRI